MDESTLPPSPSWFLPNILATRDDGSLAYGSKNHIVILKTVSSKNLETLTITNAHKQRVTSVAFPPEDCCESFQNTVVSCSEDGFVKLWKIDTLTAFIGHESHWAENEAKGKIVCLDWSAANPHQIISAGDNNSLVLWNVLSNTTVKYGFQRLIATVIACCPHNEKLVAVGTKSGFINIINLKGNGEIVYKLRGHDNEIQSLSWCPTPYNVFRANELNEEFLLASSCQNKEVFIWRAGTDGKCEISIQIPTGSLSKKDGGQFHGKLGNSFSYLALLWHNAYKLYLSSNFGELLVFSIESYLNNISKSNELKGTKVVQNCFMVGHSYHSKGLYAIASKPMNGNIIMHEDCLIKSELKFKLDGKNDVKKINSDNFGNAKWRVVIPEPICLLWTASQDRKLVASKFNGSNLEIVFNLGTLNGGVGAIVPSPHDPNKVAIGCGDGLIRVWNLLEPSGEMQVFWQKIKDRVTSLAWHPTRDGLLAYGTSEGRVGLLDTNSNKMPTVFKPCHSHSIYALSWGPRHPANVENNSKKELSLYCVGDNTLSVYNTSNVKEDPLNLTKLIAFPFKKQSDVSWKPDYSIMAVGSDDGTIYLIEPENFKIVQTVLAFKKTIYSIVWHPTATAVGLGKLDLSPYHTYFAAGSTDNENAIGIFNCKKEKDTFTVEQVASLKGHHGHIFSVAWSSHLDCRLLSTSADGSVQVWDVIAQAPLANFSPIQKPNLSVWSPVDPDIVLTGCHNGILTLWRISKQSKTVPAPLPKAKKQKKGKENQITVAKEMSEKKISSKEPKEEPSPSIILAGMKNTETKSKEPKLFSRAWKSDSNYNFNRFYSMLKDSKIEDGENKLEFSLPFLFGNKNDEDDDDDGNGDEDDDRCRELILLEEKCLKASNNWTEYYELCLWSGKVKELIEERIKTGQLDDFLVSLAPTVSHRLWQEACLSYSKTLIEKKMFRKAATYLVGCHKIYEGINVLVNEDLYLEALCIARSRLPKSDPIFEDLIRRYGQWLFKNGSYLKACECYMYLKDYLQVAKICGKKSEPEFLSLAALAARKCGSIQLEILEATNALLKCFESNNFDLAKRICSDHDNFKHLKLLNCMYETICKLDAGNSELFSDDIISHVRKSMDEIVEFPACIPQPYQYYKVYKNKEEMFMVVAQELSLAVCSSNEEETLIHVIKALCTCCRFVQNSETETDLLFKLCSWLSPVHILSETNFFGSNKIEDSNKKDSLREFAVAAIVRNLNRNPTNENIRTWIDALSELKDWLLNEKSYKYFKNLIDVGLCEKRLISNQNVGSRNKLPNSNGEKNGDDKFFERTTDCLQQGFEDELGQMGENHEISDSESTNVISNGNLFNEVSNAAEAGFDKNGGDFLEGNNHYDKDLLNTLRNEIAEFHATKISAPNPVPIFFMLKKICSVVPESETAQTLLTNLEEKWSKLN